MNAPSPATIASEVGAAIRLIEESATSTRPESDAEVLRYWDEAEKLMGVDALSASLLKARLVHLQGKWDLAQYWLKNARQLGAGVHADYIETGIAANLGYFSHAAKLYAKCARVETGFLSEFVQVGLGCGAFPAYLEACESLERAQLTAPEPRYQDLVRRSLAAMERNGVDHVKLEAVLDIAGDVLRKHSLWWQTQEPVVHAVDHQDHASVLYQFLLAVSPSEAAALTDEVTEVLVDRDLALPGLSFSFIGIGRKEPPVPAPAVASTIRRIR